MTAHSAAYWAGARRGQLVLQRCAQCDTVRHYPRPMCPMCQSFDVATFESTRRGTVHSWTVTHHVFDASVTTDVPYALVTVDLDEGVRALARMSGDGSGLAPGVPVHLEFQPSPSGDPVLLAVLDQGGTK